MSKENSIYSIHRYLANEATREEKKALEDWINASDENKKLYEAIKKVWDVHPLEDKTKVDTHKAWLNIRNKINFENSGQGASILNLDSNRRSVDKNGSNSTRWTYNFYKIAVAALLLTAMLSIALFAIPGEWSMFSYRTNETKEQPGVEYKEIHTERGERRTLSFNDGTEVVLNYASTLRVPENYGIETRYVELNGEAYFNIATMEDKEFMVNTEEIQVEVTGTEFNIRSWSKEDLAEVVVNQGSVKVSSRVENSEFVSLTANQRTTLTRDKKLTTPETVSADKHFLWKQGHLYLEEASLSSLFRQLERKFDVDFEVADSSILEGQRVTAIYTDETLEEILEITSLTHGLDFHKDEGVIDIGNKR